MHGLHGERRETEGADDHAGGPVRRSRRTQRAIQLITQRREASTFTFTSGMVQWYGRHWWEVIDGGERRGEREAGREAGRQAGRQERGRHHFTRGEKEAKERERERDGETEGRYDEEGTRLERGRE